MKDSARQGVTIKALVGLR